MFAIIVLGIGFIMIAAIFPVSISQSRMTVDETTAAATARTATAVATRLAENADAVPAGFPGATQYYGLLPPTDLLTTPPATTATGTLPAPAAFQQIVVAGKVLSFNDERLTNAAPWNYRDNLWNTFKGSLVPPGDTRYAWVPLYRRDVTYYNNGSGAAVRIPSPFAQIYFIPVAVRNRTNYDANDLTAATGNLLPRLLLARIVPEATSTSGYVIAFDYAGADVTPAPTDTVSENCFVVISDDHFDAASGNQGRMNGRVYRVGTRRSDLDGGDPLFVNKDPTAPRPATRNLIVWELSPGADFSKDTGSNGRFHDPAAVAPDGDVDDIVALGNATKNNASDTDAISTAIRAALGWRATDNFSVPEVSATAPGLAEVFVIGRNPIPGIPGPTQYEGVTQDVSAFVTFIKVN